MNFKNTIIIMLSLIFLGNSNLIAGKERTSNVTIIPIEGPIEQALYMLSEEVLIKLLETTQRQLFYK